MERARSRAHAPGTHGPPRLVPHADEGRPQGHLRPLSRPRRARSRPRHAGAPRRDRAHHERLLAGDDRADLLDGADERAPRGAARVHVAAPRRRDDGDRVGHRDRRPATSSTRRARSRSTRPATRRPRTSTGPTSSRAGSRSGCAAARSATTSRSRREERFSEWQSEAMGDLVHVARRDGGGARVLRREHRTASAATSRTRRSARRGWSGVGHGPAAIDLNGAKFDDETEEQTRERIMKRFEKIGLPLMNRTRGSADFGGDPVASVLQDPYKRARRGADPRPGVRDGGELHRRQQATPSSRSPTP